jgi:hypothetical protein
LVEAIQDLVCRQTGVPWPDVFGRALPKVSAEMRPDGIKVSFSVEGEQERGLEALEWG